MPLAAAENSERNASKPPNCFCTAVPKKLASMRFSPVSSDGGRCGIMTGGERETGERENVRRTKQWRKKLLLRA